jgi:hypothetical protein
MAGHKKIGALAATHLAPQHTVIPLAKPASAGKEET